MKLQLTCFHCHHQQLMLQLTLLGPAFHLDCGPLQLMLGARADNERPGLGRGLDLSRCQVEMMLQPALQLHAAVVMMPAIRKQHTAAETGHMGLRQGHPGRIQDVRTPVPPQMKVLDWELRRLWLAELNIDPVQDTLDKLHDRQQIPIHMLEMVLDACNQSTCAHWHNVALFSWTVQACPGLCLARLSACLRWRLSAACCSVTLHCRHICMLTQALLAFTQIPALLLATLTLRIKLYSWLQLTSAEQAFAPSTTPAAVTSDSSACSVWTTLGK